MSADDHHVLGRRVPWGWALEHPLLGLAWHRTAVAVGYLAVLVVLFGVSYTATVATVGGTAIETLTPRFDSLTAVVIVLATGTMTILPFLYAVWNGGPVLSFTLPLVPVVLGDLAAGQYVLGVDTAIALTVGAAASAVAVLATDVRRTRSLRFWRVGRHGNVPTELLAATMVTAVAAVGVGRFVATVPSRQFEWYLPFAVCWLVPLCLLGVYWGAALRTAVATGRPDDRPEP